jgi:hypothetical protein
VAEYANPRMEFGIPIELAGNLGLPLFWIECSYLGLDPRQVSLQGRSYFDLFHNICL